MKSPTNAPLNTCFLLAATAIMLVTQAVADDSSQLLLKPKTSEQALEQATKLMRLMTPEERFDFVCGTGFGIRAVPRLGIPALQFDDASAGMRLQRKPPQAEKSTAFPCTLLLAATWDPELARKYGEAVAEEFRSAGIHFILGPGMDIYRSSLNGRNFEYLGEDPFLAACMVEAYVHGAQGVNVATTLKHYLCNETDTMRRATDALVEERVLHEINLPSFRAGVNAGSWAVMTSYNLVNGEWASQNAFLVTDLLRKDLGFKNLVMTDWVSTWYGDRLAKAGTDLEMPKGEALKTDREKVLGTPEVDRMVTDILKTGIVSGLYELESAGKFKKPEWTDKFPAHERLSLKVNHAGIVMLKNTGILPLQPSSGDKILVTGNMADWTELAGGGSAHVKGYNLKDYLETVQATFGKDHVTYNSKPDDNQIRSASLVLIFSGWKGEAKKGDGPDPMMERRLKEREGCNHPFQLPEDELIARCTELNPRTVVTLACGGGVQMDWADKAAGIFQAFYGGQTGPDALMDLITGKVNPSGKLPFSIERCEKDSPAAGEEDGIKQGRIVVDPKDLALRAKKLTGQFLQNSDKTEFYTRDIEYKEGVFVGYRWYDMKNIEPRFPFGYGLSYTTFAYEGLKVVPDADNTVKVSFSVKNTGRSAGTEIAEVYVTPAPAPVPRPPRELKGFARITLAPDEAKDLTITLPAEAFAYWSPATRGWTTEKGKYGIEVGSSSRDIRLNGNITR